MAALPAQTARVSQSPIVDGSLVYQAAVRLANKESSTIIGFVSAMAAYGTSRPFGCSPALAQEPATGGAVDWPAPD